MISTTSAKNQKYLFLLLTSVSGRDLPLCSVHKRALWSWSCASKRWPSVKVSRSQRGTAAHVVRWAALSPAPSPRAQRGLQGSRFSFSLFFDFLILEDFLIVFLFLLFFIFPFFVTCVSLHFFLFFFAFHFLFIFFLKNIFTFGQVKSDARHGRPRHQSFRVCEVNLATRKVATTVGFHSTILVFLKRSPKEANGHCSS